MRKALGVQLLSFLGMNGSNQDQCKKRTDEPIFCPFGLKKYSTMHKLINLENVNLVIRGAR